MKTANFKKGQIVYDREIKSCGIVERVASFQVTVNFGTGTYACPTSTLYRPTVKQVIKYLHDHGKRISVTTVAKHADRGTPEVIQRYIKEHKDKVAIAEKITAQKAQKDVYRIEMTVEWGGSGMYGRQAQATGHVRFKDGSYRTFTGEKTGGCGYDKESTAISTLFNQFMLGMLWRKRDNKNAQYGCRVDKWGARYDYGVGTSCYRRIVEWLGGTWEHVSSGKSHDAWVITFPKNKPRG